MRYKSCTYSRQILYSSCVQFSTLQRSFINFWLTCKKNFEQYVSIVLLVSSTIASGQKKVDTYNRTVIISTICYNETSTRFFWPSQIFSKIAIIRKKLRKPTQGASPNYMSENAIAQLIAKKIQPWLNHQMSKCHKWTFFWPGSSNTWTEWVRTLFVYNAFI